MARRKGQVVTDIDVREAVGSTGGPSGPRPVEELAAELLARADSEGVSLVGPGGLLAGLTKQVLETALEAEMTEHLGYEPHDPAGHNSGNSRNGARPKTVLTEIGPVELQVPRDRDASFEPQIVPKRRRRLQGVDEMVCALSARGLTHGEISAYLAEVYGAQVSKETISRITDRVMEGMTAWQNRPLDRVYPVIFIDAIVVKIREGQVANRPIYLAIGVTVDGERDILGIWAGDGGEGAKYWAHVLTEIKNRGVADVCILVCDGLSGLPDAVGMVWPQTIVQTCVVHLIRNSFRYASRRDWPALAKDLKPIYTAPTEAAAHERLAEFAGRWEAKYPAIVRLWEAAWAEFVPFLSFAVEVREVIYTTNAIESVNARIRRAVKARGHFPTETAALKCVYLALMSLDATGTARQRWTNRWKAALNAFSIAFPGRILTIK
ncbi:MAG TPA: IS256 family transposase [Acidimicrobiales bacterium]|nr:IS256 family transposase [Acidimicrobiales bacterium]